MVSEQDGDLPVEEVLLAAPSEGGGGDDDARSSMEEEPSLAGDAAGKGGSLLVGPLRGTSPEDACPGSASPDVSSDVIMEEVSEQEEQVGRSAPRMVNILIEGEQNQDYDGIGCDIRESIYALEELYMDDEEMAAVYDEDKEVFYQGRKRPITWRTSRPARGLTQKLKKGVQVGLRLMDRVKRGSLVADKFMVLEIFSGSSMLTRVAAETPGWGAYQPIDVLLSEDGDMTVKANREKVKNMVRNLKPDLVVITPDLGVLGRGFDKIGMNWMRSGGPNCHFGAWEGRSGTSRRRRGACASRSNRRGQRRWRPSTWWSETPSTGSWWISASLG